MHPLALNSEIQQTQSALISPIDSIDVSVLHQIAGGDSEPLIVSVDHKKIGGTPVILF